MSELKTCPKCEAQLPPRFTTGRLVCIKCGWSDRPEKTLHSNIPIVEQTLNAAENMLEEVFPRDYKSVDENTNKSVMKSGNLHTKMLGVSVIALGILSSMNFFSAGSRLHISGLSLTDLRSEGGRTVAEAYYQEIGQFGLGYASAAFAMGWGTLAISIGFGGSLILKK